MDLKEDYLVPSQLAKRWHMKESTLATWRWMKRGPKFKKMGYFVVYPIEEVRWWETRYPNFKKARR